MSTPADWSLPAASFSAPVLGSDQSACPANENYILISRSSCPTNGVHFTPGKLNVAQALHITEVLAPLFGRQAARPDECDS